MFNETELIQYEKELQKQNINLTDEELKQVLEFMYSIGIITYDFINN